MKPIKSYGQLFEILDGALEVRGLKSFLSRVYALDLFINNIDRHFGNYLFRESYNKAVIGLAFDFGRSWYAYSPYGYDALASDYNTAICHRIIHSKGQFDRDVASATLGEILSIEKSRIVSILGSIPTEWLGDDPRQELLAWWGSEDTVARINQLKASLR